jgi:hypothetical protein
MSVDVANLTDEEVLAVLQELTAEIRDELPAEEQDSVDSEATARQVLASLTESAGTDLSPEPGDPGTESAWAMASARQVLAAALEDPEAAEVARRLTAEPPQNEQMIVLGGLEVAIVLGALVTLLQTKVHLKVERKDGKTDVSFEVKKKAAETSLISQVVKIAGGLLGG